MTAHAKGGTRAVSENGSTASTADTVPRLALSPAEAAKTLGVSRDFLDEHVMPELRIVHRGRRKLIAVRELERWLAAEAALTVGEGAVSAVTVTAAHCEVPANRAVRASCAPARPGPHTAEGV